MTRKSVLLGLAALAVAAIAAGGALSATTSVTITTPKANQKVSLKQNPYLAVAGTANFAATTRERHASSCAATGVARATTTPTSASRPAPTAATAAG